MGSLSRSLLTRCSSNALRASAYNGASAALTAFTHDRSHTRSMLPSVRSSSLAYAPFSALAGVFPLFFAISGLFIPAPAGVFPLSRLASSLLVGRSNNSEFRIPNSEFALFPRQHLKKFAIFRGTPTAGSFSALAGLRFFPSSPSPVLSHSRLREYIALRSNISHANGVYRTRTASISRTKCIAERLRAHNSFLFTPFCAMLCIWRY